MSRNSPTIEALRAFAEFADAGGVRAAARKMSSSQPGVTRKLNAFKKGGNCDAILLTENGQRLELTDAGVAVLPAVRELVRQYDQLINYMNGEAEAIHRVRMATGHFGAEYYLPRMLDKQLSQEIQLEIQVVRGRERILGVAEGRYDLALLSHTPSDIAQILQDEGKSPDMVHVEHLHSQLMVVIAARKSPEGRELQLLSMEKSVPISKLKNWELLGLDQNSGIRRQLESHFLPGERICFLTDGGGWSAARELCRRGFGVAVLPLATLTAADRKDFVIRRLTDRIAGEESVISRSQELAAGPKRILDRLKAVARQHQKEVQQTWNRWLPKTK